MIALAVFGAYTAISLFRLMQLNPTSWDLGIYTEYVKQAAHLAAPVADIRGAGFNLFGDHFQPIVAIIAPFFRVFPSAATLLVAQALLAALSVFPVSQDRAGEAWSRSRPGDRRGVRVLLGPAADGRLRLPRDRVRGTAPGLLAVGAGSRPAEGCGLVGGSPGLRQGRPGLHRRRYRPLPDRHRPARESPGARGRRRSGGPGSRCRGQPPSPGSVGADGRRRIGPACSC